MYPKSIYLHKIKLNEYSTQDNRVSKQGRNKIL